MCELVNQMTNKDYHQKEKQEMKKSTTFYIYEVGPLYLLIIFTLSTVIAFYQLLTGNEFVNNFFNLIVACFLQLTVGWLSFASMGRIKINATKEPFPIFLFRRIKASGKAKTKQSTVLAKERSSAKTRGL